MKKNLVLVFLILLICSTTYAQSSIPPKEEPKKVEEKKPITIIDQYQELVKSINKNIELETLKKEYLILQLRYFLGVPKDYSYDEKNWKFDPPTTEKSKEVK